MPSSPTITSTDLTTFVAGATIKSGEFNNNFSIWRGHLVPVHPNTSTVATTTTYDLGSTSAAWRNAYVQTHSVVEQSTVTTSPQSGYLNVYAKTDGRLYKRTSAGAESEMAVYKAPTIQKFTSGSGTYTTPTGCRWIRVRMVGGGGGGGGGSSTAAANGGTGGTGGTTTFGTSLLTCTGGVGGVNFGSPGGAGGTATMNSPAIGTALAGGTGGMSAGFISAGEYGTGGSGASSPLGGSGGGGGAADAGDAAASNTGSGGGGGASTGTSGRGGSGGGSGAWIDCIIADPSSTYSYAVGAAGTAGTAGTSGTAGGAGGSGYIEVTEYY